MRRPRRTAPTMDEKSSSTSTRPEASRATSVPRPSHGDADVGRLQRGSIVDAVAGHGHDLARGAQRLHDAQLLFGHDARKDACAPDPRAHGFVAELHELRTADHFAVVEPGCAGDGARGPHVVARDHHDADTGGAALLDGRAHLRPQRVGQAEQAHELEGKVMLALGQLAGPEARARDAQQAKALGGHRLHLYHERFGPALVEVTELGDGLGGALGRDHIVLAIGRAVHARQRQELTRQRILTHQLPVGVQVLGVGQVAVAERFERQLHGVERVALARQDRVLDRLVKLLGDGHPCRGHVERDAAPGKLLHTHAVFGQRAGLVHAQHRRGAQRLTDAMRRVSTLALDSR